MTAYKSGIPQTCLKVLYKATAPEVTEKKPSEVLLLATLTKWQEAIFQDQLTIHYTKTDFGIMPLV